MVAVTIATNGNNKRRGDDECSWQGSALDCAIAAAEIDEMASLSGAGTVMAIWRPRRA
jgi:hypothetical protein